MDEQHEEICAIKLEQFIAKAKVLSFKIIGTIKTIFKHKKYILEAYLSKKVVVRCFKRYNQFQALHSLIRMKHMNYDMGQFPSKFQIINREESRKEYFQILLNKIVQDHSEKDHTDRIIDSNRRLLSIIYLFLTSNINEQKKEQKLTPKKKRYIQQIDETRLEKQQDEEQSNFQIKTQPMKIKPKIQQKFFHQVKVKKQHRFSYEQPRQSDFDFHEKPRRNSLENEFNSLISDARKVNTNQFEFKFEHEDKWKRRYLVINDSGMFLYADRLDNNFRTRVQLFRIRVQFEKRRKNIVDHFCQKMEFQVTRTFKQNPNILTIFHEYDYQKIQIRKPIQRGEDPEYQHMVLRELKEKIIQASQRSPVVPEFNGVFKPIGKLFIFLHKIKLVWKKNKEDWTIFLRIKTGPVMYDSKPLMYSQEINVQQGFLIPITSTYETITLECLIVKDEGWVKENTAIPKIMGKWSFNMNELLNYPQGYLLDRVNIPLQTKQSKTQKYSTNICASIENFSDLSSVYSESFMNDNDGKMITQIKGFENIDILIITIDRVLRVLGNIALKVQAFWRNVYHFKYPRMGYTFFFLLIIVALFFQINQCFKLLLFVIVCIILYQHQKIKGIVDEIMERYFYSKIHNKFQFPQMLSTNQLKFMKWSNHINYMAQQFQIIDGKMQRIGDKKKTIFQFWVHGKKFTVRQAQQSFFEKMKQAKKVIQLIHRMISFIVSMVEKIANLLSWVDPKRTIFIICLLYILLGIANGWLIRIIVTLFSTHRLVKGMEYYTKKHYKLNRTFGIYGIRYIINKHFPQLLGQKKNEELSLYSERELDRVISQVLFPIHDSNSMNILKEQMQEIMGVYVDPEELDLACLKKNSFKLGYLINMVESCESKLKLKEISGIEERTNQFQELRERTKQIPVIDIWLEGFVLNFILNIQSQLYHKFAQNNLRSLKKHQKKHKL